MLKIAYGKTYKIFMLFLTVWIGLGLLKPVLVVDLSIIHIILTSVIILALFLCFYLLRGTQRLIPAIITGVITLWLFFHDLAATINHINMYFWWVSSPQAVRTIKTIPLYQHINIIIVTLLLIPFALLLARISKLRLITALSLFAGLLYCAIFKLEIDKVAVCFCLLFVFFVLAELLQNMVNRQKTIVCLLPFLGIYMLILLIIPLRSEPYEWRFIRTIYNNVYEIVLNISDNIASSFEPRQESFGMDIVGFADDARLGVGLTNRSREELIITQKSGRRMAIYLRGNVFDVFEGLSWKSTANEMEDEPLLDTIELIYAIERFDPDNRINYLGSSEINVTYTGINTNFLFAPKKLLKVDTSQVGDITQFGSEFRFDSLKGRGTEYNITYFQMNSGLENFREMVLSEHGYKYETQQPEITTFDYLILLNEPVDMLEKKLKERSENIHQQYMARYPISDDVRAFLYEVTKDAENDYEKCKALENAFIGTNFKYTRTPDLPPEDKHFLDYFLLESYSGYCTYYATAFTLLVRELGLPSRYVQGFMVFDTELGKRPVTVRNTMAHAWPEVYFEGIGWISFEPTPGFRGFRYQHWQPVPSHGAIPGYVQQSEQESDLLSSVADEMESTPDERKYSIFALIFTIIITIIIAFVLFAIIDFLVKKVRFKRYGLNRQFTEHVRINLQILNLLGLHFNPGETLSEFKERIIISEKSLSLAFFELCEYFLYRNNTADSGMINQVLTDRKTIFETVRVEGIWSYYLFRFRLLFR